MIPISRPSLSSVERELLLQAFDSGWISSRGEFIETFEQEFAAAHSVRHAVAVANGTVALHVALLAAGVAPGDEVIVPALTYVASAAAVRHCGARPVFVDVDPDTWCVAPQLVATAITHRTRAVMSVDLYGYPVDLDVLRAAIDSPEIKIVSDAAEGLGARRDGALSAAHADVATFSFFGNKVITSGEGGCLLTNDDDLAARARLLRNHGTEGSDRYNHVIVGYNYRLTNLQAAVLLGQWRRRDELVSARERVIAAYESLLADAPGVTLQASDPTIRRSPWMMSLLLGERGPALRNAVGGQLAAAGVETRNFFLPLCDLVPFRGDRVAGGAAISRHISERGINLPTFPDLADDDLDSVATTVLKALDHVDGGGGV